MSALGNSSYLDFGAVTAGVAVVDDGLTDVNVADRLVADLCKGGDAEVSVILRGSFFSFSASISSFL